MCKRMHRTRGMQGKNHTRRCQWWRSRKKLPWRLVWVALMNPPGQKDAWHPLSNSADDCGLIHSWDPPKSYWPCVLRWIFTQLYELLCFVYITRVLWFSVLSYLFLFFTVYKNVRTETLNEKLTFIQGFIPCVKHCLTLLHSGWWPKPVPSHRIFTRVPS